MLHYLSPDHQRGNSLKSIGVRRVKFVKPVASVSLNNLSNNPTANLKSSNKSRTQQRLCFLFFLSSSTIITKYAVTPHRAMSSMTAYQKLNGKLQLSMLLCKEYIHFQQCYQITETVGKKVSFLTKCSMISFQSFPCTFFQSNQTLLW